jgi:hypothetical protein
MKYIIAVIMMICSTAHAGPATPECYYGLNGYPVSTPKWEITSKFNHFAWFCGDRKHTKVVVTGFSCRAGKCSDAVFGEAVQAVTRASAKVGTANNYWNQYVTVNCGEAQAEPLNQEMCDDRAAWIERRRPVWVNEVKWWVGQ